MKTRILNAWPVVRAVLLVCVAGALCFGCGGSGSDDTPAGPTLTAVSTDIFEGAPLAQIHAYNQNGCTGGNVLPRWTWAWSPAEPAGLQSYAVTCRDLTVPWVHFVVYNLQKTSMGVGGLLPPGAVVGPNTYGGTGYGGPCPPPGQTHTYVFQVWALDILDLSTTAGFNPNDPANIVAAIQAHAITSAGISTTYVRP